MSYSIHGTRYPPTLANFEGWQGSRGILGAFGYDRCPHHESLLPPPSQPSKLALYSVQYNILVYSTVKPSMLHLLVLQVQVEYSYSHNCLHIRAMIVCLVQSLYFFNVLISINRTHTPGYFEHLVHTAYWLNLSDCTPLLTCRDNRTLWASTTNVQIFTCFTIYSLHRLHVWFDISIIFSKN